jgi:RNA polymerase sigma-70 factor, ECF subfamily
MREGRRVVAGEAILSGVVTTDRSRIDRPGAEPTQADHEVAMLEDLVREHTDLVYRISYAALHSHHDAEDATQETFVRVLRYRSKLGQVADLKSWLARIAWRVAVDRSRNRKWTCEIPLDDPEKPADIESSATPADETIQGSQLEATLEKLISALPRKLRDPLLLSAIEGISPREVAVTLGINEAAVRSRVSRARQVLKKKLAQQMSQSR